MCVSANCSDKKNSENFSKNVLVLYFDFRVAIFYLIYLFVNNFLSDVVTF